ncbi:hypothetical protein ACQQ64_09860 [Corynebacterium diphtheriae]
MALPVVECIDFVSDVGEDVLAVLVHGFLGCPHVGYSLMGSTGSASMTMAFPLGCTVGPWLWMDGLDPLFLQSQGPQYLVPRPNPSELINAL